MFRFNSLFLRAAIAALLGVAVGLACGPFFGIEVLPMRKQALLAAPTISFERELRGLVAKPQDELPVVEEGYSGNEADQTAQTVEATEFAGDVLDRIKKMREQATGEAAYGLGDGLAPAVRDYTAGAVSFRHGDTDGARAHFQAVIALAGAEQRRSRELWAHYMLGRMAAQHGEQEEAVKQFEATRAVARNGMPDPLGLALASYGEEARVAWQKGQSAHAVELYATQAAYGSQIALNSLLTVADLILKDDHLLDEAMQDARMRRLLFVCINGNHSRAFYVGPEGNESNVDRVVAALERHPAQKIDGAGLLAAAAYSVGRFDLAGKLVNIEDVPLTDWVRAKLALRQGNREMALTEFEKALEGFAEAGSPAKAETRAIKVEAGVLRVSRGDYLQALDLFQNLAGDAAAPREGMDQNYWSGFADYWGDAAYLAERVLTMNELRHYVDHQAPAGKANKAGERLGNLLARRLMRAGRRDEALRYFNDPATRAAATQYTKALGLANSKWQPDFLRAEAWFRAATLARQKGMEMLGYERAPDWAMWDGNYAPDNDNDPAAKKEPKPKDAFESDDERARVAASEPERAVRYQYRLTAVEEATQAANLLPQKSQAFAAVLCEASAWAIDREPGQAQEIYQRYVKNGAYVAWGGTFGRTCPAPNFGVSSVYGIPRRLARLERHVKAHPAYAGLGVLGGLGIILTALYLGWWRTRLAD